jgi:DNA-binding MarR family transcriptional regulator
LLASNYQRAKGRALATSVDTETAQRLRMALGRLARALRPTQVSLAANLTPTRVVVLLTTVRTGPVRMAEVAQQEGLNPTLLSRTVAHLVEDGLVTRSADASDRRSAWLEATAAGRELAEQIRAERTRAVEHALSALGPEDRSLIEAALPALEALAQNLHEATR